MLDVGIIGCGTAGSALAIFLSRAGHRVTLYERVPEPGPVGAGIVLQPSGMAVLARLGLLERVLSRGARIDRLHCVTANHATLIDLRYAKISPDLFGLGLHRGVLFGALYDTVRREGITLRLGHDIRGIREEGDTHALLIDSNGMEHGPHALVVVADGANSQLRGASTLPHRVSRYPWGALWFVGEDPARTYERELYQVVHGTTRLLGLLPTGLGPRHSSTRRLVSLFWSIRSDHVDEWRRRGFEAWKREILSYDHRTACLLDQIESPEQVLYSSYYDVVMPSCHTSCVLYIGDAAHAMSPQLGQGSNLALYDAMVLADSISHVPRDLRAAMRMYGLARRSHVGYYQFATRWLTLFFQSDHGWLGWLRDRSMRFIARFPPIEDAMLRSMAGVKRGVVRRSLALGPIAETLLRHGLPSDRAAAGP